MGKNLKKSFTAILLSLCMILGMFPAEFTETVFADWEDNVCCFLCGEFKDPSEFCDECWICWDCIDAADELHCNNCGECCNPMEKGGGCGNSGDWLCFECLQDEGLHCDSCNACFCEEPEFICDGCGRCEECSGYAICEECGMCDGCVEHCPECGNCDYESEACVYGEEHCINECELCPNCEEVCFYGTGEDPCDYCGFCSNCCEEEACPDCGMCAEDPDYDSHICDDCGICLTTTDVCETCGLCIECCLARAEELGCICGDYCWSEIDSDIICKNCGVCFHLVPKCETCGLCDACCAEVSLVYGCGCKEHVCVKSDGWTEHFNQYHSSFVDTHSATPESAWTFDEEYHYKVCKFCDREEHITSKTAHRFDTNGRCAVCGYVKGVEVFITKQPKSVTAKSSYDDADDDSEWNVSNNTVRFSVTAKGKGLTYQWYSTYDGTSVEYFERFGYKIPESASDISGSTSSMITVCVPPDLCNFDHQRHFRCLVSDGTTSVWSDVATLTVNHNYILRPTGIAPTDEGHYYMCCGNGCEETKLEKHTFDAWVWDYDTHMRRTSRCTVCGYEKEYLVHSHADWMEDHIFGDSYTEDGFNPGTDTDKWELTEGTEGYPDAVYACEDNYGNIWKVDWTSHTGWCYESGCLDKPTKVSTSHAFGSWEGVNYPPTTGTGTGLIYRECGICGYQQYAVDSDGNPVLWKWGIHPVVYENCSGNVMFAKIGDEITVRPDKVEDKVFIGYRIEYMYLVTRSGQNIYIGTASSVSATECNDDGSYTFAVPTSVNNHDIVGAGGITIRARYSSGLVCPHDNTEVVGEVIATCGHGGYTGDLVCSDCGKCLEKGTETLPGDHGEIIACTEDIYRYNASGEIVTDRQGNPVVLARAYHAPSCADRTNGNEADEICSVCGEVVKYGKIMLWKNAHDYRTYVPHYCDDLNYPNIEFIRCAKCGQYGMTPKVVHNPNVGYEDRNKVDATCTTVGYTGDRYCKACNELIKTGTVIPATGHSWDSGVVTLEPTSDYAGRKVYTCSTCGGTKTEILPKAAVVNGIVRIYGDGRYETSRAAADELKNILGVDKFDNIIVASGVVEADALAGSYLAATKHAPILLVANSNRVMDDTAAYIRENLNPGGMVYVLGGPGAVPEAFEGRLDGDGFIIKRLAGVNRFDTNIEILKEAGVTEGDEILVCTGFNFADSLSASGTGRPILLVANNLTANQKKYLDDRGTNNSFFLIGGEGAVKPAIAEELKAYGTTKRVYGATRWETSVAVAEEFFENPQALVLAYSQDFPDGLSAGPIAAAINAPLILTLNNAKWAGVAADYVKENELDIAGAYVMGGPKLISDENAITITGIEY